MTLLRLTGLALACACALGACGNGPAALSGTSPQPGGAALPSLLRRDEAIAVVRARTEIVGRVDRPAIADPCASLLHIPDVANPSRFAARTLADLTVNLPRDLAWMRLLQDVAGVRPNPMQDPRVPRCRVDLLRIGTPQFARAYP